MSAKLKQPGKQNILLRMHPLQRMLISGIFAGLIFFLVRKGDCDLKMSAMISWDVFSLTLLITSWIVICTRTVEQIRHYARREDGSRIFVFLLILLSSFASMLAVLLLLVSSDQDESRQIAFIAITVAGMILAWAMVHTIFTFHYAHMFYDDDKGKPNVHAEGLTFPGTKNPDYLDFAYFAFVIGMTFQVSDVEITSPKIRRLALMHGLLSFALNTFVVALTINMIAGLKK